jgi:DNA-binding CsgD family transcriptional regulator/PAS domain-containing protein
MVTLDEFSCLVAGVYESATRPGLWASTIADMGRVLGGNGGAVLSTGTDSVWSIENAALPDEARTSYEAYYSRMDHSLAAVRCGAVGAVRTGAELITPYRRTEFYADWLSPNRLEDGMFVRLCDGQNSHCLVVHTSNRCERFDTPERVKIFAALSVHVTQALRTQRTLAGLGRRAADLTRALDGVRHGLVIIGTDCCVVQLNSAVEAILHAGDGMQLRGGRIGVANPDTNAELHRALHDALIGDRTGVRCGHSLSCRRPSGKRAYVVHVMPLPRADETCQETGALVAIIDPADEPEPPTTLWRRIFGLTRGEAEVALRIVRGSSPKDIAEELSVSLQTVRTHLQHVFDKTDTHRQAELVHLLWALTP